MPELAIQDDNCIFALDIGTRTVIGLLCTVENERLHVVAEEIMEHSSRVMYDGQIHDIPKVARLVSEIKRRLEEKTGRRLSQVAIAAAGRSLKTCRSSAEMEIDAQAEIDEATVYGLELAALRAAHSKFSGEDGGHNYYCVGHCTTAYYLDGFPITNLVGHRGQVIGVEIIATFLPATVVNSLYSVLYRVGLEPLSLTLEPIAAIDVAIPEDLRLLNLALVDIGAGTSDIAVTRDGSVIAYGMVPVAGDEITEALVESFLVDFQEAEKIKRQLCCGGEITYHDILGMANSISCEVALAAVEPVLERLAAEIAGNILELNGGSAPRSVFCIGGGAQVPTLAARIASRLGLPEQRVAVRGRDVIKNLPLEDRGQIVGPEGVTVLGIASLAFKRIGYQYMTIRVNGNRYRLFNSKEIKVADVLGLIEFNPRDLIGKNGRDLKFTLNGRKEVVFGGLFRPAEIQINGKKANLQTVVRDGDEIEIRRAEDGEDARALVRDYLPGGQRISYSFDGEEEQVFVKAYLNGREVSPDTEIQEGDELELEGLRTVEELARIRGYRPEDYTVLVNGNQVDWDYVVRDGDAVRLVPRQPDPGGQGIPRDEGGITVTVNGRPVRLNGSREHIFFEILNYVDFDPAGLRGGRVLLRVNGEEAGYTRVLKDGDRIEIGWEDGTGSKPE